MIGPNLSMHVKGTYACAHARIHLKFCMVATTYVDTLSLKFEQDPFRGCREIDVLLAQDLLHYSVTSYSLLFKCVHENVFTISRP